MFTVKAFIGTQSVPMKIYEALEVRYETLEYGARVEFERPGMLPSATLLLRPLEEDAAELTGAQKALNSDFHRITVENDSGVKVEDWSF